MDSPTSATMTLSLHDALPIWRRRGSPCGRGAAARGGSAARGPRASRSRYRGRARSPRVTSRRSRGRGGGSTSLSYARHLDDLDLVATVGLHEPDPHVDAERRRDVLAHEVGADRQLAMTAVDEHREADRPRPPVVDERIHRRAHRAAGEEDVVDQHDDAVVDGEVDRGLADDGRVADAREVVAVQRDVQSTERHLDTLVRPDRVAQPLRKRIPARANANDGEGGEVALALDDLVRDPVDGATHVVGTEQRGRSRTPSRPRRTGP